MMLVDEDGNVWPASRCVFREPDDPADVTDVQPVTVQAEMWTPPANA
jgi:hypothetical protein